MRQAKMIAVGLLSMGFMANAFGQAFPSKPLRIFLGIPVGGTSDVAARAIAVPMSKTLGQPIIIENRPGANATIAASLVNKAEPDGYTYFFGSAAQIHHVFNKVGGIDARTDFSPVSNIQTGGYVAVVRPTLPIKSWQELLAYSKANPDKLNFASPSSLNDMIMGMVKYRTGLTFTSIPYKGTNDVLTAMLAGQSDFTASTVGPYLSTIQSGGLRALFVTSGKRVSLVPDVPTLGEVGVPNFEVSFNVGLWSTPKAPRDAINAVSAAAAAASRQPDVVALFRKLGGDAVGSTPEEQLKTIDGELSFWVEAARIAKFVPQ